VLKKDTINLPHTRKPVSPLLISVVERNSYLIMMESLLSGNDVPESKTSDTPTHLEQSPINQDDVLVYDIAAVERTSGNSVVQHQQEEEIQEKWDPARNSNSCDPPLQTFPNSTSGNTESFWNVLSAITREESDRHPTSIETHWSLSLSPPAIVPGAELLQEQQKPGCAVAVAVVAPPTTRTRTSLTSTQRFASNLCVTMDDSICALPTRSDSLRDSRTTTLKMEVNEDEQTIFKDVTGAEDVVAIQRETNSDVILARQQQQFLSSIQIEQQQREHRSSSIMFPPCNNTDLKTADKSRRSLSVSSLYPHSSYDSSISVDFTRSSANMENNQWHAMSSATLDTNLWQDSISSEFTMMSSSQSTIKPPESSEMRFATTPLTHVQQQPQPKMDNLLPTCGCNDHPPPKHPSFSKQLEQTLPTTPSDPRHDVLTKLTTRSMDVVPNRPRRQTSEGRTQKDMTNGLDGNTFPQYYPNTPSVFSSLTTTTTTSTMKDNSHTQRISNISGSSSAYFSDSSLSSSLWSPSSVPASTASYSAIRSNCHEKGPSLMERKQAVLMAGSTKRNSTGKGFSSMPCPILERHEGSDEGEVYKLVSSTTAPAPMDTSPRPPRRTRTAEFTPEETAEDEAEMTTTYDVEYDEYWTTELESTEEDDDGHSNNKNFEEMSSQQSRRPYLAWSQQTKDSRSPIPPIRQDSLLVVDGEKTYKMGDWLNSMPRSTSKRLDDEDDYKVRAPVMPIRKSSGLPPLSAQQEQRSSQERSSGDDCSVTLCEDSRPDVASTSVASLGLPQPLELVRSNQKSRSFDDLFSSPTVSCRQRSLMQDSIKSLRRGRSWDEYESQYDTLQGSFLRETDNKASCTGNTTVDVVPEFFGIDNGSSHRRRSYEATMKSSIISRQRVPATTAIVESRGKVFVEYDDEAIARRGNFTSLSAPVRRGSLSNGESSVSNTGQSASKIPQSSLYMRSHDASSTRKPHLKDSTHYGIENSCTNAASHDTNVVKSRDIRSTGRYSRRELPPVIPRRKASSSQAPSTTSTASIFPSETSLVCSSVNTEIFPPTIPIRKPSSTFHEEENETSFPMTQ
jgi:hypothetical protein